MFNIPGPTQNTIRSRWKQIGTRDLRRRRIAEVRHKIQFDQGESKSEPNKLKQRIKDKVRHKIQFDQGESKSERSGTVVDAGLGSDTKYNSIKVKANRNWNVSLPALRTGPTQNTIRSRWKQIGTGLVKRVQSYLVRHKIQFDQGESKSELSPGLSKRTARSDTKYNSIKVKANRNIRRRRRGVWKGPTQNTIRSRWKQIGTIYSDMMWMRMVRHKIQFDQGESKSEQLLLQC